MMKKLLVIIVTVSIMLFPQVAQAHVLLNDTSGQIGAVLHVQPNDDPVVGKPSSLFFDIQSKSFYKAQLTITDPDEQITNVPVIVTGTTAASDYIFPAQGVYRLNLAISAWDNSIYTFTYAQRISRGAAGSAVKEPTQAWGEIGLMVALCGFSILAVIGFNRRKQIAFYSKW